MLYEESFKIEFLIGTFLLQQPSTFFFAHAAHMLALIVIVTFEYIYSGKKCMRVQKCSI